MSVGERRLIHTGEGEGEWRFLAARRRISRRLSLSSLRPVV